MKRLIAITGGIGCGKSMVSQLLRTMGYPVYDADKRAKDLMLENKELRSQLCNRFGEDTYLADGSLNKKHLANCIFNNPEALQTINSIVHPAVAKDLKLWADGQMNNNIFYESAILFESGFNKFADIIWSVSAPLELRIQRCLFRDRCTRENILERMRNQLPQEEKDKLAHSVIINDKRHSIIEQVRELLVKL